MVTHRATKHASFPASAWLEESQRVDFCLVFPEVQQPSRHHNCDHVAVWPEVPGNQPLNLHGPVCQGRLTDLINTLTSKGPRSSSIKGQEEIVMIVGRKGRQKLKKIRCYGLQTDFRIAVLLKINLMGSFQTNELLRTSGFPSIVLTQASILTKPDLGEGRASMYQGIAPSLASMSF